MAIASFRTKQEFMPRGQVVGAWDAWGEFLLQHSRSAFMYTSQRAAAIISRRFRMERKARTVTCLTDRAPL
eukprot:1382803-Amphidinium_carterae.1